MYSPFCGELHLAVDLGPWLGQNKRWEKSFVQVTVPHWRLPDRMSITTDLFWLVTWRIRKSCPKTFDSSWCATCLVSEKWTVVSKFHLHVSDWNYVLCLWLSYIISKFECQHLWRVKDQGKSVLVPGCPTSRWASTWENGYELEVDKETMVLIERAYHLK